MKFQVLKYGICFGWRTYHQPQTIAKNTVHDDGVEDVHWSANHASCTHHSPSGIDAELQLTVTIRAIIIVLGVVMVRNQHQMIL